MGCFRMRDDKVASTGVILDFFTRVASCFAYPFVAELWHIEHICYVVFIMAQVTASRYCSLGFSLSDFSSKILKRVC